MNYRFLLTTVFLTLTSVSGADTSAQKAEKLLQTLSLEEKAGQMTQLTLTAFESKPGELSQKKIRDAIATYHIGSILNVPNPAAPTTKGWAEVMQRIADETEATEKKIPILYGIDTIHGANYTKGATLFPQQIGMAATWNPILVERAGEISAYETRASSIPWVFSPDLDLPRNPLWSRTWETFGQDVHLSARMGVALMRGYQGSDIADPNRVAACIKHFVGYGSPTTGKDRTPSLIPARVLKQYDLEIFRPAIKAGAKSIMIASGEVNGTPVHANKHLLTDVLQNELGFKGLILTDWEDIIYLHNRHKVAPTLKEAVRLAIDAGIDMSMVPNDYEFTKHLIALVQEGSLSEERINKSVRKILALKYELGLFDRPLVAAEGDYPDFGSDNFRKAAYDTAAESITLLRNVDGVLPLPKTTKILVTGPTANKLTSLNGGWTYTWQGEKADEWAPEELTVLEALTAEFGKENVTFSEGATITEEKNIAATVEAAKDVEVIVVCLGEHNYTETPGDIDDLNMTWPQQALVVELAKLDKPLIAVLLEGRPRTFPAIASELDAVVHAYLPGNLGGVALADILSGDVNPSGALPLNYPLTSGGTQAYNHKGTENLTYPKPAYAPLFEFGQGLSYTTFAFSQLKVNKANFTKADTVKVSVLVKNTGERTGKKVVQLYLNDHYASITPEARSLKGFEKVKLAPGESQEVKFELEPRAFQFVNAKGEWVAEAGTFSVMVGDQKVDLELVE